VASARGGTARPLRIETLRPGRARSSPPRIWIQPEDDVPHIRDRIEHLGHRAALAPSQIRVASSLTAAVSDVLRSGNLLLCPCDQASELGLRWRPLAGAPVTRGFAPAAASDADSDRIRDLGDLIGHCLGSPKASAAPTAGTGGMR